MAMSGYYLDPDSSDAESIRTIQRARELGVSRLDTAEIYGPYANEELVGRDLQGRRDEVVLATKFGLVSHTGEGPGVLDSTPANIRAAIEGSLKRLGTDRIDLCEARRRSEGALALPARGDRRLPRRNARGRPQRRRTEAGAQAAAAAWWRGNRASASGGRRGCDRLVASYGSACRVRSVPYSS
jgi:Aldo/keto reductase family